MAIGYQSYRLEVDSNNRDYEAEYLFGGLGFSARHQQDVHAGYARSCKAETFSAETWWKRNPDEVLDMMVDRFREICRAPAPY